MYSKKHCDKSVEVMRIQEGASGERSVSDSADREETRDQGWRDARAGSEGSANSLITMIDRENKKALLKLIRTRAAHA